MARLAPAEIVAHRSRWRRALHRLRVSAPGRLLNLPLRARIAAGYFLPGLLRIPPWLLRSAEDTTFTYSLSQLNGRQLAHFLSLISGIPLDELASYFEEAWQDEALRGHVCRMNRLVPQRYFADARCEFGWRVGSYALVRALKPRIVVETGVDKGLHAVLLSAALLRNRNEGRPGRYHGFDINPSAGYLLCGRYAEAGAVHVGDSLQALGTFGERIDLFIYDSVRSGAYELAEYSAVARLLSPGAIVVGTNCLNTGCLVDLAEASGRAFLLFREQPVRHWYPGGGIGFCFSPHHDEEGYRDTPWRSSTIS